MAQGEPWGGQEVADIPSKSWEHNMESEGNSGIPGAPLPPAPQPSLPRILQLWGILALGVTALAG